MKLFIVHVNLGCCANNSDGKIFVSAETEQMAREIANKHTKYPIAMVETFDVNNEVIYSSFKMDNSYRFRNMVDGMQCIGLIDCNKTVILLEERI